MRTSDFLGSLIRSHILELEPYHSARESVRDGVLLDANENPFATDLYGVSLNRYPDPSQTELRSALATRERVDFDQVLAANGSDEVLDWIFKVFCVGSTEPVAIAEPTYGMYAVTAGIFGIPVFEFRLGDGFQFEAHRFLKIVPPEVNVLFLCTPNNPTGNILSRDQILQLAHEWGRIVVVDEAYLEFSGVGSLARDVATNPNIIVVRTFSKALGRAGLRLGFTVADPLVIRCFMKVKAPYNLNAVVLTEGLRALKDESKSRREIEAILRERTRVAEALGQHPQVQEVFPSWANFLLFRCANASAVCRGLLREGIVVRDRSGLSGLHDCIRVSIGTEEENSIFLDRLQFHLERKGHVSA